MANEVAETVFESVNLETDKIEQKKKAKQKQRFDDDEKESDCILHGYIKKLGGPFASAWQTRYAKLYPNRLELHPESGNGKPELIFMDQLEDVSADLVIVKNEQCIILKTKDTKIVLTNSRARAGVIRYVDVDLAIALVSRRVFIDAAILLVVRVFCLASRGLPSQRGSRRGGV
ncbi:Beta-adrenergic receptor kinase 2 [Sarracenia purpurea var. burkii]